MCYTDDPEADYRAYCREQDRQLDKLPKCSECDEPIQSDECYEFNGELICPDCLKTYHRKWVDDYVS